MVSKLACLVEPLLEANLMKRILRLALLAHLAFLLLVASRQEVAFGEAFRLAGRKRVDFRPSG